MDCSLSPRCSHRSVCGFGGSTTRIAVAGGPSLVLSHWLGLSSCWFSLFKTVNQARINTVLTRRKFFPARWRLAEHFLGGEVGNIRAGIVHHRKWSALRLHLVSLVEHSFTCPYCGEEISMVLDLSVRRQTYVEDCEVCCNPIEVSYTVEDDALADFSAKTLE